MATCRLDQENLWYVGILYLLITTSLIHVWEDHQPMASKRCKIETCWIKWKLWQTIWVHDSYTSFFLTKDSDTEMQLEWLVCAIATSPFKLKPYWAPISAFPNSMVSKSSENLREHSIYVFPWWIGAGWETYQGGEWLTFGLRTWPTVSSSLNPNGIFSKMDIF